ncbi:acylphosphatase [Lacicoccus alkaliphilus]|uniref:Acylphosphatase n=1 Tax=Lacicoccus alkaliphilus DSM 16010 TaxID=1123231 RepID=A0A1M7H6A5_9BACL|nr:acylphosphatase [Salinicoccus alkaliphilus]SHM24084.1 D-alanine-D-alanine ligase [Salinicoccus alkaliphilus DSM 16010]
MNNPNHMPHLVNSLPKGVTGFTTSSYLVALEGWRRGLKLKFHNNKRGATAISRAITYSLSDGENEYHFLCARGPKSHKDAIDDAEHKSNAYEVMERNGVPVPQNKKFDFTETSIEKICEYGESLGYPLVVKPPNMGAGHGVVTNINTREHLIESLIQVREHYNKNNEVMIEKYFENGVDYRFYVIKDKVIGVSKNYSSFVRGDGSSNLEQLVHKTNKMIKNSPGMPSRTIKIDDSMIEFLKEKNMDLEYIPEDGKRVFVRKHGTYLSKRLSVACTEETSPKLKKYAVDALNSFPGLASGSVDMIVNEEKQEAIVNEINTRGEIQMHTLPFEGKSVDVPKHIIDFYFPESKKISNNFRFEYKPIKEAFLNGYADEITIPMYPKGEQYQKRYSVYGVNLKAVYRAKLQQQAAKLNLKGHIDVQSTKRLEINLIGKKNQINKFDQYLNTFSTSRSKVNKITSTELEKFEGIASISFEIINNEMPKIEKAHKRLLKKYETLNNEVESDKESKDQEIAELKKELETYKKSYNDMRRSRSWRVTSPVRKVKSFLKKK